MGEAEVAVGAGVARVGVGEKREGAGEGEGVAALDVARVGAAEVVVGVGGGVGDGVGATDEGVVLQDDDKGTRYSTSLSKEEGTPRPSPLR